MTFLLICIAALVGLGIIAAVASIFSKGGTDDDIVEPHDCASCSAVADGSCKIGCLLEEKKREKNNKTGDQ